MKLSKLKCFGHETKPSSEVSAYGRIAVKIAHRIGDTQSSVASARKTCRPMRDRLTFGFALRLLRLPDLHRGVGHPSTSWKLFQTKMMIGTSEIVSSTTAIAEP